MLPNLPSQLLLPLPMLSALPKLTTLPTTLLSSRRKKKRRLRRDPNKHHKKTGEGLRINYVTQWGNDGGSLSIMPGHKGVGTGIKEEGVRFPSNWCYAAYEWPLTLTHFQIYIDLMLHTGVRTCYINTLYCCIEYIIMDRP